MGDDPPTRLAASGIRPEPAAISVSVAGVGWSWNGGTGFGVFSGVFMGPHDTPWRWTSEVRADKKSQASAAASPRSLTGSVDSGNDLRPD